MLSLRSGSRRNLDGNVGRTHPRWFVVAAGLAAYALGLNAQLLTRVDAIPRNGKPPVVFLNGYQFGCPDVPTFAGTFAQADAVLQRDGRVSLFFNNCEQGRNRPIEELGVTFGRYLDSLRYTDGTPLSEVDVVAHSMGGLIVRAYLSGKQAERREFRPPEFVKIRKAVFLAVPFFGAIITENALASGTVSPDDPQFAQLRPGSAFVYDLATWNQGIDDLREIDAIAVVANGGSGLGGNQERGFDDSTVSITSAGLGFVMADRTRVLPMCHTRLTGLLALGCSVQTPLPGITDENHDAAKIILSFLNGTDAWRTVGSAPTTTAGGVLAEYTDAQDRPVTVQSATAQQGTVRIRGERFWSENLPSAEPASVAITTATGTARASMEIRPGTVTAYRLSEGPNIAAVLPSPSQGFPRVVSPGMFVTIYGSQLATQTAQAPAQPYPSSLAGVEVQVNGIAIPVQYVSPTQINVLMPDNAVGLVKLTVRNSIGHHTLNVLTESAVPTLFGVALNAQSGAVITTAAPARRGDFIALYLTGLGLTNRRETLDWATVAPVVLVGGRPCTLQYAGRAPGFAGLDQVNCQIASDAATGDAVIASVQVGTRIGTATIPVR